MTSSRTRSQLGKLIAKVLTGAWRAAPPPLNISAEELQSIAQLLLQSGSAALGWWRLRKTELQNHPVATELQQAYRLHALRAKLCEAEIRRALALLNKAGIEAVLIKGWAVAKLYPQPGLRPYGDIDLCFRPQQTAAAESILEDFTSEHLTVDIHQGFSRIDTLDDDSLFEKSEVEYLGDVRIQVLSREDELRVLCTHLLRHGVWRPLWLCDIAASIEALPADFDWQRFFGKEAIQADWLACTIGLAHQLLGAEIEHTPILSRAKNLPSWLVPQVLKNWQDFLAHDRSMHSYLRHPKGLIQAVRKRWPDPIQTTIVHQLPLDESSRLPYQLKEVVSRTAKLFKALPEAFKDN
jgi:hypothetical protein